jgi:hypothetical protein
MEFIIAKNYWDEDEFVINVLKFEKMEWGYLHGFNDEPLVPTFIHIDTIYHETEDDRDSEFKKMECDGYIIINDFEPPANTHDYTQDVEWNQRRRGN